MGVLYPESLVFRIFSLNVESNLISGPATTRFKAYCFEILRDATLFRSPMGKEFSASVWDRCQSRIKKNLDSNWPNDDNFYLETQQDWGIGLDISPLNWLGDGSSVCGHVNGRPAVSWQENDCLINIKSIGFNESLIYRLSKSAYFHLLTHALFKALLFICAGVIH